MMMAKMRGELKRNEIIMVTKMIMMVVMEGQPNFKPVSSGSALELHPQGNALRCSTLTTDVPSRVEAMFSCSVLVQHHIWEGRRCPYLCPAVQSPPKFCPYVQQCKVHILAAL